MHRYRNRRISCEPHLRPYARALRKNGTLGEVLLWRQLRVRQLGCQFHRQVPVSSYIVDFFCHELSLVIEVDGSSHNEAVEPYDALRQADLERLGLRVLRFQERDVRRNMAGVIAMIKVAIDENSRADSKDIRRDVS